MGLNKGATVPPSKGCVKGAYVSVKNLSFVYWIPGRYIDWTLLTHFLPALHFSSHMFSLNDRVLSLFADTLSFSRVSQWPQQSVTPPSKEMMSLSSLTSTHAHAYIHTEGTTALDSCLSIWPTLWVYLTFDLCHWSALGGLAAVNRDTQHFEQWRVYTDSRCNVWSQK